MKLKTAIISKQLHSSCSTVSSEDVFLYVNTFKNKIDFDVVEGEIQSVNFPFLNGEVIYRIEENQMLLDINLLADETYYRGWLRASKQEMKDIAKRYIDKGWTTDRPPFLDEFYDRQSRARVETRTLQGYVIPAWGKDLNPEAYQGGLSDELFKNAYLQRYVKGGLVCGYMGATERTFEIDRAVERFSKKAQHSNNELAVFLTSSSGRHFADQLDTAEDVDKNFNGYWPNAMEWWEPAVKEAKELAAK